MKGLSLVTFSGCVESGLKNLDFGARRMSSTPRSRWHLELSPFLSGFILRLLYKRAGL